MSNIIGFNKSDKPEDVVEPIYNYTFTFTQADSDPVTVAGLFTFNPMFYGVTDREQRLLFGVPAERVLHVYRSEIGTTQ